MNVVGRATHDAKAEDDTEIKHVEDIQVIFNVIKIYHPHPT